MVDNTACEPDITGVPLMDKSKPLTFPVTVPALINASIILPLSCSRIDRFGDTTGLLLSQLSVPVTLTVPLFNAKFVTFSTPLACDCGAAPSNIRVPPLRSSPCIVRSVVPTVVTLLADSCSVAFTSAAVLSAVKAKVEFDRFTMPLNAPPTAEPKLNAVLARFVATFSVPLPVSS
ncbi:Uncharacterised protein [Yersinia rohdei]|nr:Uncharacterised protein [Yersinia rohdei]